MTIYATHSSTKADPRFRVYIPTSEQMDVETYEAITHDILGRLIEAGYPEKRKISGSQTKAHGLDTGKLHAASLFYLPSVPADENAAYCRTFARNGRKPLDVRDWIESLEPEDDGFVYDPSVGTSLSRDQDRIDRAVADFRNAAPGTGHNEFWRLGCRLKAAGCSYIEVNDILITEAHKARSPRERLREIPRAIKKLFRC